MKFCTGSSPGTNINIDVDAINGSGSGGTVCVPSINLYYGWVRVYEGPSTLAGCDFTYSTNHFSQISEVGSNSDITGVSQDGRDIKCPKSNQCYYVQVETAASTLIKQDLI